MHAQWATNAHWGVFRFFAPVWPRLGAQPPRSLTQLRRRVRGQPGAETRALRQVITAEGQPQIFRPGPGPEPILFCDVLLVLVVGVVAGACCLSLSWGLPLTIIARTVGVLHTVLGVLHRVLGALHKGTRGTTQGARGTTQGAKGTASAPEG